mgnify:FL=1
MKISQLREIIKEEVRKAVEEGYDTHWHGDWTPDEPEPRYSSDPCDQYWPHNREAYDRCRDDQIERMRQPTSGESMNPAWESRSRKGKRV